jgi:hypothetical protein
MLMLHHPETRSMNRRTVLLAGLALPLLPRLASVLAGT